MTGERHGAQATDLAMPPALSAAERAIASLLPSLTDTIFVLCLLGTVFVLQGKVLGLDGDIGWHLQLGLRTLSGHLPRTDFLSYTAYGRPLVGMEWLAEMCYAAVWKLAGLNGVVALAGAIIAVTCTGFFAALRARGTPLLLALVLALLGIALTSIHWVSRPHLFSFPLTLWWSEWLWRYWRDGRSRRLWAFPCVMVLWVNLHGGFVSGLILLGTGVAVAWLFPRSHGKADPRALTYTLIACVAASFANPWGWSWVGYFAAYFADPLVTANTQELQSPDFHTLVGRLFLGLLLLLAAIWMLGNRSAQTPASDNSPDAAGTSRATQIVAEAHRSYPEPLAWATAAIWTILAMNAIRAVPLWALVVIPLLAESLTRTLSAPAATESPAQGRRLAQWHDRSMRISRRLDATERLVGRGLWSGLALAFTLAVTLNGGRVPFTSQTVLAAQFPSSVFPVAAVERMMREGVPPGHGFSTVQWGGYLAYALPGNRVFIDSRSDFYGQRILSDYLDIVDVSPSWQSLLGRYQVAWALVPANMPLTQVMRLSGSWSCQAMDTTGVAVLCIRSRQSMQGMHSAQIVQGLAASP